MPRITGLRPVMVPFQTLPQPQFRHMKLPARMLGHWSSETVIDSASRRQPSGPTVSYSCDDLNPAFGGFTAQRRFLILPRLRCGFRSSGRELVLRFSLAEMTHAAVQPDSTSIAACLTVHPVATSCHNRQWIDRTKNLYGGSSNRCRQLTSIKTSDQRLCVQDLLCRVFITARGTLQSGKVDTVCRHRFESSNAARVDRLLRCLD